MKEREEEVEREGERGGERGKEITIVDKSVNAKRRLKDIFRYLCKNI